MNDAEQDENAWWLVNENEWEQYPKAEVKDRVFKFEQISSQGKGEVKERGPE